MWLRVCSALGIVFVLITCQPVPATNPTDMGSPRKALSPTATASQHPTTTQAVIPTPTVSPDELKRRASPICEGAFSALVESETLTPPFAVMKKEAYTEGAVWELSQQLPHMSSFSARAVRTLFCISETRTQTGTYTDGSAAYQLFWELRAVSWPGGKVIGRKSFTGSLPPRTKELASASAEALSPYKEFTAWIFNQVDHPDFLYFKDAVTSLAVSPDGSIVAFGTAIDDQIVDKDYQAKIFLFNPSEMQTELGTSSFLDALAGHQGRVTSLAFSPDGSILASSGFDLLVKFWDVSTGRLLGQTNTADTPNSLTFSVDGSKLAIGSNLEMIFIDPVSRRVSGSTPQAGGDHLAFSPDGGEVYAYSPGRIKIIDPTANRVTLTFPDPFALVPTLSVAEDGSTHVSYESPEAVDGFALSPDGLRIVTFTIDRSIDLNSGVENVRLTTWDAQTGKYISEVRFAGDLIQAIEFSPDGNLLAIGNRNEVWIWDTATWQVKEKYAGHVGEIADLAFSPDGTRLVSASRDDTVRVWFLEE